MRTALSALNTLLRAVSNTLLLGTDSSDPSGDSAFDQINVKRSQGTNAEYDEIMVSLTSCLMLNNSRCTPNRIPGLTKDFYGLNALLLLFNANVQSLCMDDDSALRPTNSFYEFAAAASVLDVGDGFVRVGDHYAKELAYLTQFFPTLTLVFFVVALGVTLVIMLLCFLPIPAILTSTSVTTQKIWSISNMEQAEAIQWSDELETHAGRMDYAHKALVEALAGLVHMVQNHDPQEKIKEQSELLVLLTSVHFADEEELMAKTNYPKAAKDEHWKAHAHLFRSLIEFASSCSEGRCSLSEVVTFCSMWIVNHILGLDGQLGIYLVQYVKPVILDATPNFDKLTIPQSVIDFYNGPETTLKDKADYREMIRRVRLHH
jgi:hemerythrin-like metal-binding protein